MHCEVYFPLNQEIYFSIGGGNGASMGAGFEALSSPTPLLHPGGRDFRRLQGGYLGLSRA